MIDNDEWGVFLIKTLVIGDIHGCYNEFLALINKADLNSGDKIIALGDIIDRGPNSKEILHYFINNSDANSLMGNHERKHILSYEGKIKPSFSQLITKHKFGEIYYAEAIEFMKKFPIFIDIPEAILIHGFFEPNIALEEQNVKVLLGTVTGEKVLINKYQEPWYKLYKEEKPIIVGHQEYQSDGKPFIYKNKIFCLDTGCCHGKALSGLILPDFKVLSVPSKIDYWMKEKSDFFFLKFSKGSDLPLTWKRLEILLSDPNNLRRFTGNNKNNLIIFNKFVKEAYNTLEILYNHIIAEKEKIINNLENEKLSRKLSEREVDKVFALTVKDHPFKRLLFIAKNGDLSLEKIKELYRNPIELIKYMLESELFKTDNYVK